MSGGHFDYRQSAIQEIIYGLEKVIEKETETRPPLVQELCVSVWRIESETCMCSTHYHFDTYEEALEYFKGCGYIIDVISTEPQKRKFRASIDSKVSNDKKLTFEVCEFIYEYYEDKDGEQVWYGDYSKETLDEFRKGLDILNKAYIYAQRIDWLISGDDGEESFHRRLKEDLEEYENSKHE